MTRHCFFRRQRHHIIGLTMAQNSYCIRRCSKADPGCRNIIEHEKIDRLAIKLLPRVTSSVRRFRGERDKDLARCLASEQISHDVERW